MGTKPDKERDAADHGGDLKYIEFLKKKQKMFMRQEQQENASRPKEVQFSFISDSGADEVDWKVFFEDFLQQHLDTCFWASAMLRYFQNEYLPSEKRWVDIVFYEKFARSLLSTTNEELNIDFSSYKQSVLVDIMIVKNSPKKLAAHANDKDTIVRNLAQTINKSLRKRDNPFHVLIKAFKSIFLKEFRARLKALRLNGCDDDCLPRDENKANAQEKKPGLEQSVVGNDDCKEALSGIEYFIRAMMYSISLFYKSVIGEERLLHLRELIVNAVLNCVVRGDVYDILFVLLRLQHGAEEAVIRRRCELMQDVKPQTLGINEYLCLNDASPLFRVAKENNMVTPKPSASDVPSAHIKPPPTQEEAKSAPPPLINSSVDPHTSVLAPELVLQERLQTPPYREAVEWLRRIARIGTPLKKLKCIAKINSVICQCIDNFWHDLRLNPDRLMIDADQYISIMIYVIIKARVPDLFTHIALAGELAALGARSQYNAYCLTTLQACLFHMLSMEEKASTRDGSPAGARPDPVSMKPKSGLQSICKATQRTGTAKERRGSR